MSELVEELRNDANVLEERLRAELAAERALADQLAASLKAVLQDEFSYVEGEDDAWLSYAAALAAYRAARTQENSNG